MFRGKLNHPNTDIQRAVNDEGMSELINGTETSIQSEYHTGIIPVYIPACAPALTEENGLYIHIFFLISSHTWVHPLLQPAVPDASLPSITQLYNGKVSAVNEGD